MQTITKKTLSMYKASPLHIDRIPGIAVTARGNHYCLYIRHTGRKHFRAIVNTGDGISGYSARVFDEARPDPMCFGSICKSPVKYRDKTMIVFSNCTVQPGRENFYSRRCIRLTLKTSFDSAFRSSLLHDGILCPYAACVRRHR
jgi:hypothetical protein